MSFDLSNLGNMSPEEQMDFMILFAKGQVETALKYKVYGKRKVLRPKILFLLDP